jgi:aryl-alcohol dehydrogenase-like predicted oxidoreductase
MTAAPRAPGGVLGSTGLTTSRLGFGCYRVDDETPGHRAALLRAIETGCSLIDTSTNYTDGHSESLVGEVLDDLGRRDKERRREIVLVSKIGYVQGQNLGLALDRERARRPFPEMVRYMDGCWHCIHPEFLRDQLTRSRRRLRVETLDVCLLHNPEYFLSDAAHRKDAPIEEARATFYRRLRDAFAFLEEAAKAGEIRFYGVSSNTCVSPAGDPEATSVSLMLAAARSAAGENHRFRVLQLPMNLFETGAALEANTGPDGARTALEAASGGGLGVLVNRPLNAIIGGRLLRLAAAAGRNADAVAEIIDPALPAARRSEPLSRKAIWVLSSTPGVGNVLVGMRRPEYVDDAMAVETWEPLADPLAVLRRTRDALAAS